MKFRSNCAVSKVSTLVIALAIAGVVAGCGRELDIENATPPPTFTAIAPSGVTAIVTEQPTKAPTSTGTPVAPASVQATATPSETPLPTVTATVNVRNLNVRKGPGLSFSVVGQVHAGEIYPVFGRTPSGQWLEIAYDGSEAWIFGSYVVVNQGLESVQVSAADPTATPSPTPTVALAATPVAPEPILPTDTPIAPRGVTATPVSTPIAPPPPMATRTPQSTMTLPPP